ncbi:MAG: L-threonylcarbamoyladenylate synthase [Bacillota bacterium]
MKNGDLIIIPTDTVYGLAAKLYDRVALEKIYKIKGRDQSKQIPILCSKTSDLVTIIKSNSVSRELMRNLWPGPVTFIFPTLREYFELTGEKTIAARIPNHPLALELIEKYGVLRVTSLNKSGEPPFTDIEQIKREFGPYVAEIYEQKRDPSNISSTVVDLSTGGIEILREGTVTEEDLKDALRRIQTFITPK